MRFTLYSLLLFFMINCVSPFQSFAKMKFIVASDSQGHPHGVNEEVFGQILSHIKEESPDLVFFLGDLVYGANDLAEHQKELALFKNMMSRYLDLDKFYATIGNHEVSTFEHIELFRNTFVFPQNGPRKYKELVYYVEDKGNLFVMLATDYYGEMGYVSDEQMRWLEEVLAANKNANHIFVFGHEPAFPVGRHVGFSLDQYPERRDALWKLFRKYNVDAYVCGHEHLYSTGYRDGIYQIIAGGSGGSLARGFDGDFHHYVVFELDGEKVHVLVKDNTGVLKRSFSFMRKKGVQKITVEDVMHYGERDMISAIKSGVSDVAWMAALAVGKLNMQSTIPYLIEESGKKMDYMGKLRMRMRSAKNNDEKAKIGEEMDLCAYFLIHAVRSLRLMNAREAIPLFQRAKTDPINSLSHEANYALDKLGST